MRHLFLMFFMICIYPLYALMSDDVEEQFDQININKCVDETLFISLGSWCNVAANLRKNEMRKAAFPFDWITSVDCEKFLEIFATDFKYFLDDKYLSIKDSHILNHYYKLEFPHEEKFFSPLTLKEWTAKEWVAFKEKYTRKINRFKNLKNYKGKVYFIRSSFGYSNHPTRYFKCAENISISDQYAWRLFHVIKNRFPRLDFVLIIYEVEKSNQKLSENLIRLKDISDLKTMN